MLLTLENANGDSQVPRFPLEISIVMEPKAIGAYTYVVANYAFILTMIVMCSFFVMMGQIRQVS